MAPTLLVVGGGRMGTALVRGLCSAGWATSDITVVEVDQERRSELAEQLQVATSAVPVAADGAVLAVKPSVAEQACRALAEVPVPRWLSIMAGIPLGRLESWAGAGVAVVRAMPNTPAVVGAGVSALAGGRTALPVDLLWARQLLAAVGHVVEVVEEDLDAVTAVSGSGPAYVFLVTEALADAGIRAGLDPSVSRDLAVRTVIGAARLMAESGERPEALRAQVTSPNGTTEAAVAVLERLGLRQAFDQAVEAAAERSRQLGSDPS